MSEETIQKVSAVDVNIDKLQKFVSIFTFIPATPEPTWHVLIMIVSAKVSVESAGEENYIGLVSAEK